MRLLDPDVVWLLVYSIVCEFMKRDRKSQYVSPIFVGVFAHQVTRITISLDAVIAALSAIVIGG